MSNATEHDDDADFIAGFDSTVPEPVIQTASSNPADHAPAPTAPATSTEGAAKPEPTVEEADPFAGLPQAVRDLLADVPKMRTEVESLRRAAGQVPALQSQIDKLKAERTAPPPTGAATASRFEKVDNLRSQGLDDIADAMDEIAAAMPGKTATTKEEPPAAPASQQATTTTEADDPVIAALDGARPTWSNELFGTDCQLWLSRQDPAFQTKVRTTNNPGVILEALGKFDAFKAQTSTRQQSESARLQRMSAAATPRGDGRSVRAPAQGEDEDADMNAGFYGRR